MLNGYTWYLGLSKLTLGEGFYHLHKARKDGLKKTLTEIIIFEATSKLGGIIFARKKCPRDYAANPRVASLLCCLIYMSNKHSKEAMLRLAK